MAQKRANVTKMHGHFYVDQVGREFVHALHVSPTISPKSGLGVQLQLELRCGAGGADLLLPWTFSSLKARRRASFRRATPPQPRVHCKTRTGSLRLYRIWHENAISHPPRQVELE
jgi:hypothetical protein